MSKKLLYFLIGVIIYLLYTRHRNTYKQIETWSPYMSCPFKNWETAPSNAVYFPQIRYRKPYNYPYRFESSYPVKHYRHMEQKY